MLRVNNLAGFGISGEPVQDVTLRPSSVLNWQDTFLASLTGGETHGWSNFNIRHVFLASALSLSGPSCRIVFETGTLYPLTIYDAVYIGKKAVSGDAYDMDGSQVQATGEDGLTTITVADGIAATDRIVFPIDETANYVVALHVYDSPDDMGLYGVGAATGVTTYANMGASDASVSNVGAYSFGPSTWQGIKRIQVEVIDDVFFAPTVTQ